MSSVYEEGQHLRLGPSARVALADLREQTSRSSGPGGQSVNKLDTAVELWIAVDAILGLDEHAQARLRKIAGSKLTKSDEVHLRTETARSQRDNRQTNREKLAELVARALHRPKVRRKTKPSRGAVRRRLEAKRQHGEKKQRRRADRVG
ncbi:MAG: alternative ribosome rescue aminoacyl-tRNA hydrolase ArfB [Planctomycetota bacterium]